jgi:probable rRNA maturation factor
MRNTSAMTDDNHQISVEYAVDSHSLPSPEQIRGWVGNALTGLCASASLDVRVVDSEEIRLANHRYRHIDKATNVLSFPADLPPEIELNHLGDILISAAVVEEEADSQGKTCEAHWAHLITHGVLHLLGHDHEEDSAALEMETLEREILARIGIDDPYQQA